MQLTRSVVELNVYGYCKWNKCAVSSPFSAVFMFNMVLYEMVKFLNIVKLWNYFQTSKYFQNVWYCINLSTTSMAWITPPLLLFIVKYWNAQFIYLCNPQKTSVNVCLMKILKSTGTKKLIVCFNNLGEENFT